MEVVCGFSEEDLVPSVEAGGSSSVDSRLCPVTADGGGTPRCTLCSSSMWKAIVDPMDTFEYKDVIEYCCYGCKVSKSGNRWWCDACDRSDMCFDCTPDDAVTPPIYCATPYHYARRLLRAISMRERNEGVPYVGAILTTVSHIERLKERVERALLAADVKDYKVGFQRMCFLPGDRRYVVAHMSTHTAKNVMLHPQLCSAGKETNIEEIYFGVRLCDPIFGGVESRANGNQFILSNSQFSNSTRFTFAEIFAGIGGFRLGLEPLGGQCVFTSELNEAARATMAANFPPTCMAGDITAVYANQLPDFDILTAGFPCQPFSIRGEQGGLDDPRGQLFRELIRILNVKRPKAFLFENVTGLVYLNGGRQNKLGQPQSTDIGQTFSYILNEFEAAGYDVSWKIIDAKHWLAQSRQRVYITGFRSDLGLKGDSHWPSAGVTCDGPGIGLRVRDILETNPQCLVQLTQEQWDKMQTPEYLEKTNKWRGLVGGTRSKEIKLDEKAPTLTSGYKNAANEATRYLFKDADGSVLKTPRFLTPRECCRLMGFPESFCIPLEKISVRGKVLTGAKSESQFYYQIGNAVCPPVIQAIGDEMLRTMCI